MEKNQKGLSHLFILLGVLVVAVIGFVAYRTYSAHADRQKFIEARAAIDTIYADIVTKVGKPDNYKRTNDCSRPSQEFTQGPLSCSVGTDFIYGVDNEDQANAKLKSIQTAIAVHTKEFKPTKPLANTIKDTLVVNTYYHSATDYYKTPADMSCTASYNYDTPRETFLTMPLNNKKTFFGTIDCLGGAQAQYYPLSN